ncbi:hypothetical protein [Streptomyces griseoluteus]|uniref:hypothetical protein n=1 Tax=Streptomyces griseoluteus TaxID=29306 RepID=UPI00382C98FE
MLGLSNASGALRGCARASCYARRIRRHVIQRADHTEERSYGSAQTGGFDAADSTRRVDTAAGDVTVAVQQWLVQTGRIHPNAHLTHPEIRTWRPR